MKLCVRYVLLLSVLGLFTAGKVAAEPKAKVVGRFRIKGPNGKYYGGEKILVFTDNHGKNRQCAIRHKDTGYFSEKLPAGRYYLKQVQYNAGGYYGNGDFFRNLPENYLSFYIAAAERTYYIGDMVMEWDIDMKDETAGSKSGATGVIPALIAMSVDNKRKPEAQTITLSVVATTRARFAAKYKVDTSQIIAAPAILKK